jgi:hypothetical protein
MGRVRKTLEAVKRRRRLVAILGLVLGAGLVAWVLLQDGEPAGEPPGIPPQIDVAPTRRPTTTPSPTEAPSPTASPEGSAPVESTSDAVTPAAPAPTDVPADTLAQPVVLVTDFGATPDDGSDDTSAIQAAMNSMRSGGTLLFPPGEYRYSNTLSLPHDNVALWGYDGAYLHNTRSDDSYLRHIAIKGNNSGIYGFRISTDRHSRGTSGADYLIMLTDGANQEAIDNQLEWGGIHITGGASGYLVSGNSVLDSTADSIRHTDGATNGVVAGNYVRGAGDDMISVVSTRGERKNAGIVIEGNDLADQYWGRGISVVGGDNITIRNNSISGTACCAAILVAQEDVYNTMGVRNVVVEGNVISHVQTQGQPKNGVRRLHPAILVNGNFAGAIQNVTILNNRIDDAAYGGIGVRDNACNIEITGNVMVQIAELGIDLGSGVNAGCRVRCSGNTLDDLPVTHFRCSGA